MIGAAGDIACDPTQTQTADACHEQETSNLLLKGRYGAVLALGDTQYGGGALSQFMETYDPTWGRLKAITHPALGNHEYDVDPAGYFAYFGAAAGDPKKGYYSFDIGSWHIVVLNSNCSYVACESGSLQDHWLRSDLAAHPSVCTLAMWHHPRFSSSEGTQPATLAFWQDLYAAGADVVLNGHEHNYERFAPQNSNGNPNQAHGIREFVVGTGGDDLESFGNTVEANSVSRDARDFGILQLTLHPRSYDWRFIPEGSTSKPFADSGSATCH